MSNLTVSEVLDRAADLIEPEGAWTQGSYARTAEGNYFTHGGANGAVCWCALGAIDKIAFTRDRESPNTLWNEAATQLAILLPARAGLNDTITAFNDSRERTQSEVVAKLREAAALAREQGK